MRRNGRWIAGLAVACGVALVLAATASAQAPERGAPAIDLGPMGEPQGLDTMIQSLNLRDADLGQIVRILAERAGVNVAIGQRIEGSVSCSLKNVTTRSALEAFLRSNGYDFIERDGVLVVVSPEQQKEIEGAGLQPQVVRRSFHLPYSGNETDFVTTTGGEGGQVAPATKPGKPVEEIIEKMLSPAGKMAFYERQHLLIIEDVAPVVELVQEFVDALWAPPTQVFIESSLVEVSLDEDDILGLSWNALSKLGDSGATAHVRHLSTTPSPARSGTSFESTGRSPLGVTEGFKYGIINSDLEVILEALRGRKRVDLRSNPRMLVMNHHTASIVVGQEIPYTDTEESTGAGILRTTEFKEVAMRLDVTPHVSDNGMVFMNVHPSVKAIAEIVEGTDQPSLSTREAVTTVAVQDGATLIIGGLVQRNRNKSYSETPYLARIPLIGLLFRQKNHTDTKNDLVFLLTPRILTPELMEAEMDRSERLREPIEPHAGEDADGDFAW